MRPTLYLLTGPSAVGKTEFSLDWAERHNAEIISCDSLLCYRGMHIGTARPSPAALRRVPHHGMDLCPVRRQLSIREYLAAAEKAVRDVLSRSRNVLVVGGSGFYLKAFFAPVVDTLEIPQGVRQEVTELYAKQGLDGVVRRLRDLNPQGLSPLDIRNPRRVLKALERCLAAQQPLKELRARFAAQRTPFDGFQKELCRLSRSRESLYRRVELRTKLMLKEGLVEEVHALKAQGLLENPSAAAAIGYREVLACLRGDAGFGELEAAIVRRTRALIRKQCTWFLQQLPPHRVVNLDAISTNDYCDCPFIFEGSPMDA